MSLRCKHVEKAIGDPATHILHDVSFDIDDGEFVSLTGRSGSGKSTLLYLLSSLDQPTSGTVEIDGHRLASMPSEDLHRFRNRHMGFVFQFHYLIDELTALENVLMPARKDKEEERRRERAIHLLSQFGLENKTDRLPRQLSGGEQQRVAIARALIMEPRYLFADEPTGSLDTANAAIVMKIIKEANEQKHTTVILVTHDQNFAKMAPRQIQLIDGRVASDNKE